MPDDPNAVDPSGGYGFGGLGGMAQPGMIPPWMAQAYAADPRRMLVQSIMQMGQQSLQQPTYSPWSALAKALTIGVGGASAAKLADQYSSGNIDGNAMSKALEPILGADHATTVGVKSSDPNVRLMAMNSIPGAIAAMSKVQGARPNEIVRTVPAGGTLTNVQPLEAIGKKIQDRNTLFGQNPNDPGLRAMDSEIIKNGADAGFVYGYGPDGTIRQMGPIGAAQPGYKGQVAGSEAAGKLPSEKELKQTVGPTVLSPTDRLMVPGGAGNAAPAGPAATAPPGGAGGPSAPAPGLNVGAPAQYPPTDVMAPRVKLFNDTIAKAHLATDEAQTAALLRQRLDAMGANGPSAPFFAKLSRYAQSIGVPEDVLKQFNLPNGSSEETAQKLSTDLLNVVMKQTFPQRITNADITLEKPTQPNTSQMKSTYDFLFDNVINPRVQRDIELGRHVAGMDASDPSLSTLNKKILDFNAEHPLSKYTPALQPPKPTIQQIEQEMMRRRGGQ